MPDRSAEPADAIFLPCPNDDRCLDDFLAISLERLLPGREGLHIVHFDIVVQFLVDGRPILEGLSYGMGLEFDLDRGLRAMAGRLEPEVFEPLVRPVAEAVHGAVEMDRRAGLLGVHDPLEHFQVLVPGGAFVVDDDIVALRPFRVFINIKRRVDALVIRPPNVDLHVGQGGNPLG